MLLTLLYFIFCLDYIQKSYNFVISLWKEIKRKTNNNPDIIYLFVGLKRDMEEEREVSIPVIATRCIDLQIARQFAITNRIDFFEISLYTGNEKNELRKTLVSIVSKTQSLQVNYLIQACSIHLEFLQMKEAGKKDPTRQLLLEGVLRKNPYKAKVGVLLIRKEQYYKYSKEELEKELVLLKNEYVQLIQKKEDGKYKFFLSF